MADKHFFNKILLQKQKRKREDLHEDEEKEGRENVELTLGLSLNGKFGVDPRKGSNKLKRSCSAITTFDKTMRFELDPSPPSCTPSWVGGGLARTCSLPVVEEDEESRKRKELQTIRRREAKRRLSEKLKSCGAAAATNEEEVDEVDEEVEEEERDGSLPRMVSQGSSGSSGLSEFESQTTPPNHGINKATEAKSPQSVQSFSEQKNASQDVKPSRSVSAPNEMAKNVLADMPCVFTKGDGPNGKRVDGFLYRYKKGEEVRIVCVCHGTFLTPAEFIKHAGGGDVEHPLRHIVVNPTPFL